MGVMYENANNMRNAFSERNTRQATSCTRSYDIEIALQKVASDFSENGP